MTHWFLIVFLWFNGGGVRQSVHEFNSYEECDRSLKALVLNVSHGNESEAMATAYCAPQKP